MIFDPIFLLCSSPVGILIVLIQFVLCKIAKHNAVRLIPTFVFGLAAFCGLLLAMEPVASLVGLDTLAGYLVLACAVGGEVLVGLGWIVWNFWQAKDR